MELERNITMAGHSNRLDFVDPSWAATASLPRDPPLLEDGRAQAWELAARLRSEGVRRILASPVLRTVETTCIVAQEFSLLVMVERGLSEWMNATWLQSLPRAHPSDRDGRRGSR